MPRNILRRIVLAALPLLVAGCGSSTVPTPAASVKPHYGFDAMFVPADSWNNPPGSDGYSGHYRMHNHVPWIPLKMVRELLGDVGVGSTWHQGRLRLTVPAAIPVNLAQLPAPAPAAVSSGAAVAINRHLVAWVPVWRPGAQAVYLPASATLHALSRLGMKMGLAPQKPDGETLTWTIGAPNYRAIFVTIKLTRNSSVTSSGMLWVHQGTVWISGTTLGNAVPKGISVQWPINQRGAVMRLVVAAPHFRGVHRAMARPSGTHVVPILVNGHRMGYVRWATAPDNSDYFVLSAVMPVLRSMGIPLHVATTANGVVHWIFNEARLSS